MTLLAARFGKLKYVHHNIDIFSDFQWATALNLENTYSAITFLIEVMTIIDIPAQLKTENGQAYVSKKMK